jgi:hypothetical protein
MLDHDELLATTRTLVLWTVVLLVLGGVLIGFVLRGLWS